jgi:hypothetical protein
MKTGHIKLKNPFKAVKTPFKDYELTDGSLINKKHITIKNKMIIAVNYILAKRLNWKTIGEIQLPTDEEIKKDILSFNAKKKQDLEIKRQAEIAVAIITKNSEKLNSLLNQ